jgi:hypothetical protein
VIKNAAIFTALLLISLVTGTCDLFEEIPPEENYYPEKEAWRFYAYDISEPRGPGDAQNYYEIAAVQLREGSKCEVWVDRTIKVSEDTAKAIADKFDTKIYPDNTDTFGSYEIIFKDPVSIKLFILILDIRDSYNKNGNRGFVAGYFDSRDLSDYKYSNGSPILYIDAYPNEIDSELTYSTIAHEFQHLINYCTSVKLRGYAMDTWIDEGLSCAAEYIYHGDADTSRLEHFNEDPRGTIARGNNFFIWGEDRDEGFDTTLDDYASVFLFFRWLDIQSGGRDIYRDIAQSTKYDHEAVTGAAAKRFGGGDAASFKNWDTLFGTWLKANYMGSADGREGYKGKIKPRVWAVPGGSGNEYKLYPGGAVYTKFDGTGTDTADIKYLSMTRTPEASNNQYPAGDTKRLVMFNAITDVYSSNGSFREDTIKQVTLPEGGKGETNPAISTSARSVLNKPYPVDARSVRGRGPDRRGPVPPAALFRGETPRPKVFQPASEN